MQARGKSAVNKAKEQYEAGKDRAKEQYEAGKDKAKNQYEAGKDKAREQYEAGKDKAKEQYQSVIAKVSEEGTRFFGNMDGGTGDDGVVMKRYLKMKNELGSLGCWVASDRSNKPANQKKDGGGDGGASITYALKQGKITPEKAQEYRQINHDSNVARHQT